ncbi:MAG: molybdopterin-dependent oxidoreductase [Acidimicrobiaceae bacterium]|nr:molybdopterin-dependent oxidoreductase [Acidimicrobiaceae bacterium]
MTDQASSDNHQDASTGAARSAMGALAGAAGAAVGLGFGELIEGASESIPSLVVAVSELLSDYTPGDVVRFSIANFGASQKTLLTVGIIVGSLVLGGGLGRFAVRGRPRVTLVGFALFGLLGGWAAARNPISPAASSWVVGLAAAALAAGTTLLLTGRIAGRAATARSTLPVDAGQPDPGGGIEAPRGEPTTRRAFFAYAVGAGAAALAMVGLGRALRGQSAAEQFLEANTLRSTAATTTAPPPSTTKAAAATESPSSTTAAPASAGPSVQEQVAALDTLDDDVAGISSYVTPNDSFYRIDTAFGRVPQIDPANWRLRIGGMVDNPYELTFDEIQAMELSDHVITLSCVSNRVGGNLVGNAVWTGVPLSVLLDRAGVQAGADQVVGRSVDDWTAGFPTPLVYDGRNAILAIGMNDEFLPTNHGFPARLVVAGLYGYVSAVKWIDEIQLTTWDGFDGYWVPRGWSKEGPMKTQSRIDVPDTGRSLTAGQTTPIAGIAWAPTRGIERVEVNIDNAGWLPCQLGEALGDESWVQWHREWTPSEGRHRIQVRATDGDGITQSGEEVDPAPNGAEGWHAITVAVDA